MSSQIPALLFACGISLRIEHIGNGVFRVNSGSLLPAVNRTERRARRTSSEKER